MPRGRLSRNKVTLNQPGQSPNTIPRKRVPLLIPCAPLIHCHALHWSGTIGFHGWMDDVYRTNALDIVAAENTWCSHRGNKNTYVCCVPVNGSPASQTLMISPADFKDAEGKALATWMLVDELGFCGKLEFKDAQKSAEAPV